MRLLVPLAALALVASRPAAAALNVVSSVETLGSLAKEVGGDRVDVHSLGKGYQDPHFVEPKPNLMLVLNKADLLLHVGLELEIGWLPPLVLGSRNPKIQTGELGNLDCSRAIPVLDVPTTKVDRSMGDIHPLGNPHYWLPPANAKIIAREIAQRLSQIDPSGAATYQKNLAAFNGKVDAAAKKWQPMVDKMRGVKIVTYHKSWTYVSQWLGMEEIGYLEPKPGIPPDPDHLFRLIQAIRSEHVQLLLVEDFYNLNTARLVAQKGGLLEILVADSLLQLLLEPVEFFLVVLVLLQWLRNFADMFDSFVHGLKQPFQALAKCRVTIRTAKPPGFFEVGLGETASGTFKIGPGGGLRHFLRRAQSEQQVGQRKAGRVVNPLFLRARLAQVHLLGFAFDHLSQVDRSHVLFANVAQHNLLSSRLAQLAPALKQLD